MRKFAIGNLAHTLTSETERICQVTNEEGETRHYGLKPNDALIWANMLYLASGMRGYKEVFNSGEKDTSHIVFKTEEKGTLCLTIKYNRILLGDGYSVTAFNLENLEEGDFSKELLDWTYDAISKYVGKIIPLNWNEMEDFIDRFANEIIGIRDISQEERVEIRKACQMYIYMLYDNGCEVCKEPLILKFGYRWDRLDEDTPVELQIIPHHGLIELNDLAEPSRSMKIGLNLRTPMDAFKKAIQVTYDAMNRVNTEGDRAHIMTDMFENRRKLVDRMYSILWDVSTKKISDFIDWMEDKEIEFDHEDYAKRCMTFIYHKDRTDQISYEFSKQDLRIITQDDPIFISMNLYRSGIASDIITGLKYAIEKTLRDSGPNDPDEIVYDGFNPKLYFKRHLQKMIKMDLPEMEKSAIDISTSQVLSVLDTLGFDLKQIAFGEDSLGIYFGFKYKNMILVVFNANMLFATITCTCPDVPTFNCMLERSIDESIIDFIGRVHKQMDEDFNRLTEERYRLQTGRLEGMRSWNADRNLLLAIEHEIAADQYSMTESLETDYSSNEIAEIIHNSAKHFVNTLEEHGYCFAYMDVDTIISNRYTFINSNTVYAIRLQFFDYMKSASVGFEKGVGTNQYDTMYIKYFGKEEVDPVLFSFDKENELFEFIGLDDLFEKISADYQAWFDQSSKNHHDEEMNESEDCDNDEEEESDDEPPIKEPMNELDEITCSHMKEIAITLMSQDIVYLCGRAMGTMREIFSPTKIADAVTYTAEEIHRTLLRAGFDLVRVSAYQTSQSKYRYVNGVDYDRKFMIDLKKGLKEIELKVETSPGSEKFRLAKKYDGFSWKEKSLCRLEFPIEILSDIFKDMDVLATKYRKKDEIAKQREEAKRQAEEDERRNDSFISAMVEHYRNLAPHVHPDDIATTMNRAVDMLRHHGFVCKSIHYPTNSYKTLEFVFRNRWYPGSIRFDANMNSVEILLDHSDMDSQIISPFGGFHEDSITHTYLEIDPCFIPNIKKCEMAIKKHMEDLKKKGKEKE